MMIRPNFAEAEVRLANFIEAEAHRARKRCKDALRLHLIRTNRPADWLKLFICPPGRDGDSLSKLWPEWVRINVLGCLLFAKDSPSWDERYLHLFRALYGSPSRYARISKGRAMATMLLECGATNRKGGSKVTARAVLAGRRRGTSLRLLAENV